jgi:hypothetical protein
VSKRVLVEVARVREETSLDEVWKIHLTPERTGVLRDFNGELWVQYLPNGGSELEVSGECAPHRGLLGHGFDVVFGRRIASQTCRYLLGEFGKRIEERCPRY